MRKTATIILFTFILLLHSWSAHSKQHINYGNFIIGWGPPQDYSQFNSAALIKNNSMGIFTFDRKVYQPAAGLNAFPDGGYPKYLVDRSYIATYDLNTKAIKILYEYDNIKKKKFIPGSGRFAVRYTNGDKVIVNQEGQLKTFRMKTYKSENNYFWLNTDTGNLTLLPIKEELGNMGLVFDYLYLVDTYGTIVAVCHPSDQKKYNERGVRNKKQPENVLVVRYPSGELKVVVKNFNQYHGFKDNEILYYKHPGPNETAFNLATKQYRNVPNKEYVAFSDYMNLKEKEKQLDLQVYYNKEHKAYRLYLGKHVKEKWDYTPLAITPEDIAPITDIEGIQ